MGEKQKIKQKVRNKIRLGSIFIIFFLILYIPSLILWIYGNNINTEFIRKGEIESSVNTNAYIVRNETVINSPVEGKCIREINEGERVRVNSRIVTIVDNISQVLLDDLRNLDLRIIEAKRNENENNNLFSRDLTKIEKMIDDKLILLADCVNQNNFSKIGNLRDEVDELILKQATIIGSYGEPSAHIQSLKDERDTLQNMIMENTEDIISEYTGTVSYVIDGHEHMLTPDIIEKLTLEDLENIKITENHRSHDDLIVNENSPLLKIIKDIHYDILFVMDKDEASNFEEGEKVEVRINDIDRIIDGIINYKSEKMDGKYIMAVNVDKALRETAALRKINIDLIKTRHSGFIVPIESLVNINERDMTAEIVLVRANRARFVTVKIKGRDEKLAIIKNTENSHSGGVQLYSSYILNPKNIEEGQMIE
ncbi:HlyD family efflux transporter periplasmic adaptor subunit [Herbivorax sp. ANBcel31]|uniref:HlyD family efflux transporter periplasmic adaptor subunit n=1 Tax=Herbivorax sp. ANBcel31 TaxID=3069754 RepID=UPI0027B2116E|nr:HlyD family efflux transporter periplasmic adaptor subunit [Herbivorax sp. ANBcel31]MDQ2086622.1 HlyD family efflux transporter periplasmic adaptor subunit [Herbivorax sp. ANBcel31]